MQYLNDFLQKQILFVFPKKDNVNKIHFHNENIRLLENDKPLNQISCHKLLAIFIVGDISVTSVLLKKLKLYGISMFFMNYNFDVRAKLSSSAEGNYILRQRQYLVKSNLCIAKHIVKNKINNQFILTKEYYNKLEYSERKNKIFKKIDLAKNHQELLGIEGVFAKEYFSNLFSAINWKSRLPRTKCDIPNYLLDIGYTILFNIIDAQLCLFGFDTYKGYYHKLFFQRKSLTCDIVESFRCIIDKQIISSYNLKQIHKIDFVYKNGRYWLSFDASQKYVHIFTQAIMNHKQEIYKYIYSFYKQIFNEKNNYPKFRIKG
jgi:CRISPR-associated protein Cas1